MREIAPTRRLRAAEDRARKLYPDATRVQARWYPSGANDVLVEVMFGPNGLAPGRVVVV